MAELQKIRCRVTFLPPSEGGRRTMPILCGNSYRPHLVVGDPNQRQARYKIVDGARWSDEDMLGVAFENGPQKAGLGEECDVTLVLMFYPAEEYRALTSGATFTVREGGQIVGFGTVQRWLDNSAD